MTYRLEIDSRRRMAIFTVAGSFAQSEMFRMVRDMVGHPEFLPGFDPLVDLSAVEDTPLLGSDIREKAALDQTLLSQIGSVRWAVVAKNDAVFGLARMFQALMGETRVEVGTFRDRGEAEVWLSQG